MIGSSQYECGMKSDGLCSIGVGELPNQSIMALNTRVAASVDFASVPYGMGVCLDNNEFKCGHRVPQMSRTYAKHDSLVTHVTQVLSLNL